jgi:hypothetical protein
MKTKYVFVFEDGTYPPLNMSKCYIFDNLRDATSFFNEQQFILRTYDSNIFSIQSVRCGINWSGDIFEGIYY